MSFYLMIDFGSTFTKLTAVDASAERIIGTSRAFTTIETDIREGFYNALALLEDQIGHIDYEQKFAASSAGGGLKMVAVGLVPELTAKAAAMTANSAGAKVIKTYAYELSSNELEEICEIKPDIILLCGGTDGGNKEVILKNAKSLSQLHCKFSIIYAGNKSAADEASAILSPSKHTVVTENVMPKFGVLNILPAKKAIRDIFIERIILAKGLDKAQKMMSAQIVPTPLAVLEAIELLAQGTANTKGLGELMAIDVGGATTDVYSMAHGHPTKSNVVEKGLPEPFAKRTVEGDLGLRYSMTFLLEAATAQRISGDLGISEQEVQDWVNKCTKDPSLLASKDSVEKRIDDRLAGLAVEIAFNRHCGIIESVYTPMGETFLQTGKDLSTIPYIIGIGGPVIGGVNPQEILAHALFRPNDFGILKPIKSKLMIDSGYIFAAAGLLGRKNPDLAIKIMLENLK